MYRIALCDDDNVFLSSFRTCLEKALDEKGAGYDLSVFSGAADLMTSIEEAEAFDLIFLDIVFEGENGIEVAKRIRKACPRVDIVFVTIEPGYAVDGYDIAPLHFLVKPVTPEKLDQALRRFLAKHESDKLLIKSKGALVTMSTDDIEYIEIFSHDILIHLSIGQPVSYTGTLMELESLLPLRGFARCHKSFIINLRHVSGISRYQVALTDGQTLPIGKSRYNQIQSDFVVFTQNRLADY